MPKSVTDQYPELMHYTNAAGLVGIVSSSTIWATHANFLNDSDEIKHFFDVRLFDLLLQEELQYADELAKSSTSDKKMLPSEHIETIARENANMRMRELRSATLGFNEPFIFSMSAAREPKVSSNGLLSQWRGYGSDGGYAVVFDTVGFEQLLRLENETYSYQHAEWGDVYYQGIDTATQPSTEDVAKSEKVVREAVGKIIRGGEAEGVQGIYQAISSLSCLYKHWGFSEENEVRLVVIPATDEIATLAEADGEVRLPRKPKSFLRSGIPVPYLELFAHLPGPPMTLPIKRVIVGPHRDKELRADAVRKLLASNGYQAEVTCSEIPYIGR